MNSLEKKLNGINKKKVIDNIELVNDVKLLLAADAQEEISLLKSIGLDNDIRYVESKKEDLIIRKSNTERYDRTVLHRDEIEKFCLKYRLYLKPTRKFTGTIPAELGAELVRFCKEKTIPIPNSSDYSNFYIIAPPKMFEDYTSPTEILRRAFDDANNKERERIKERIRLKNADPILVYRLPENKAYYAVIRSWGDDFTPLRRLYGFLTRKRTVNFLNTLLVIAGVFLCYKLGVWQTVKFGNIESPLFMLVIVVDILLLIGACYWTFSKWCKDFRNYIRNRITYYEENTIKQW